VRRVPNSTVPHVSASPPFHPGRYDFKSPVVRPPGCTHRGDSKTSGLPSRLHHAMNVWLPYTNCGIATYPNRAIGMAGLSPARLRPCRPLPKTPVVTWTLAIARPGLLSSAACIASTFIRLWRIYPPGTTIIHFSGLNTEPAISLHPASDPRYRFCPWTSLVSCWLNFAHMGLPQILLLSAGASSAMRFTA